MRATVFLFSLLVTISSHSLGAEICCEHIGCFSNDAPFAHLPLPWCNDKVDATFELFVRGQGGDDVTRNHIPSYYKSGKRTLFLVHGFQNDRNEPWLFQLKDAWLAKEDVNVVIAGWGGGSGTIDYTRAASNTRVAGAEMSDIVDKLKSAGTSASNFWCVGHSLGSHVCGHAGRRTSIGRITGMDPAGPLFENYDRKAGLYRDCATFVDVLHTHGKGTPRYGLMVALGHMDFYPNGAGIQPGCLTKSTKGHPHQKVSVNLACSHGRAHVYMQESLGSGCFRARQSCSDATNIPGSCSDCNGVCGVMGHGALNSGSNGLYYLEVNNKAPFCQN